MSEVKFTIDTIPFGIYSQDEHSERKICSAIGDEIIDLRYLADSGLFDDLNILPNFFSTSTLNEFIALGKSKTNAIRSKIQLAAQTSAFKHHFCPAKINDVILHLPIKIGDYTDFYSSEQHATNVGIMFRDKDNALLPNWKHIPIAYHGRASSIMVSGTNFHRPKGQIKVTEADPPIFAPTKALDFELEIATVIGKSTQLGQAINVDEAKDYVFGFVIFNDWSARDIQRWEYIPLGPFLAKNFFSSISPWVIPIEALEDFKVKAQPQDPTVLPYLQQKDPHTFDVNLEVILTTAEQVSTVISKSNFKHLYWTVAQQIAHHTSNGCPIDVGDLMASGTISGPEKSSFGSMLELAWGGKAPITLADGSQRKFIEDGDTITIRAYNEQGGKSINFGEVTNTVLP
jgi:fumarylacetoacetase